LRELGLDAIEAAGLDGVVKVGRVEWRRYGE
jgi:hypothetical protein